MDDIKFNDEPKSILKHPMDDCHAVLIGDLQILLSLKGFVSYFLV